MLAVAATVLLCQTLGKHPSLLATAEKAIATEAGRREWVRGLIDTAPPSATLRQLEFAAGSSDMLIVLEQFPSKAGAAKGLSQRRSQESSYTMIAEPQLAPIGFQIFVPDFSAKRISDMKAYAASNMFIVGTVGHAYVEIDVATDKRKGHSGKDQKALDKVYDDAVAIAKVAAQTLKK